MSMAMMSPKPKGGHASGNAGNRTPTGKTRPMAVLDRQPSRSGSHPVEVVGRIREHPEGHERESAIRVLPHSRVAVRAEGGGSGSREFSLDGVSLAAVEDLQAFYGRFVESRVDDVKAGGRCTIMMYGPTGAGKSYTMFGAAHEKGVAYHALSQLMTQRADAESGDGSIEVRATVWEIYNEEVYDLLAGVSTPKSGFGTLFKMSGSSSGRVKLEVLGRKVKTCMSITGTDPQKVLREISKVEGRRVVKSTHCNDRSSRSHCMVTIEVPEVGGKLILVDMAGSENIEQAGLGRELKMQTGKINQGNGALRRVVEAIANGDSYIPYRDSKLTMLLQDSFEDDRAKILMILCASPDLRDLHKTICTLEYGAKAKCIVRLPSSPSKDQVSSARAEQVQVLETRLSKKDAYIEKLRKENEAQQRQNEERERELQRKDRELAELREKERRRGGEKEVQKKRKGPHDGDDEDPNPSPTRRRKVEELTALVAQQQREIDLMRVRAEKAEAELLHLQRSYNLSSHGARGAPARADGSDSKEAKSGTESGGTENRAAAFGQSPAGSNQRFLDIQKQMSERILAAQAESERIIAQCTPEQSGGEKGAQRNGRGDCGKVKPAAGHNSAALAHDGSRQGGDGGNSSAGPARDVVSLTATSPSLMHLKNLVKEKEMRSLLGGEDASELGQQESMRMNAMGASVEKIGEDEEAEAWAGERLCSKGWLPIILEEDERMAQSVDAGRSATPPGSGSGAKFEGTSWTHQVTPDAARDAADRGAGAAEDAGCSPSLAFPSPEEQFNAAIASYSHGDVSGGGLGSPLFPWEGSGSRLKDPSPSALVGRSASGSGGATPRFEFVPGESKEWTPRDEGVQLDGRVAGSALRTHSPLTVLAEESPPTSAAREQRGGRRDGGERLGEAISSMRSLEESPSGREGEMAGGAEAALASAGAELFDGGMSGGSDAEAARRARIESIFLLCGERRELARKTTPSGKQWQESMSEAEVPGLPASGGRYSPTASSYGSQQFAAESQVDQSTSDWSTSLSFSDMNAACHTDASVSSLPSLMPAVSPQYFPSSRRPTRRMSMSIFANENSQPKQEAAGAEKTEVCVKWEKSGDAADGKLVCIVSVSKSSTLSELREEVEAHIPVSKKNFKFLFLGESGGAPVDREFESEVRVGSLPASQEILGSRLACLRPPSSEAHAFVRSRVESQPFRALENQLAGGIPEQAGVGAGKLARGSPVAAPGRGYVATKGLRPLNGESGRPKSALAHIVESSRCM